MSEKLSFSRTWKNRVLENYLGQNFRKFNLFLFLSWYFLKVFFLRHSPLTENMRRGSDINKNIETAMVARSPYNFSLLPHALSGKLVFKERSGFRLDHSKWTNSEVSMFSLLCIVIFSVLGPVRCCEISASLLSSLTKGQL